MNWKEKRNIMMNSEFDYPLEVSGKDNEEFLEIITNHTWEQFKQTNYYKLLLFESKD